MNPQQLISALRGPQNPLFAVPPQALQRMAGQVLQFSPPGPHPVPYSDDYWNRVGQPSGYNASNPNAFLQGMATGKITHISPRK